MIYNANHPKSRAAHLICCDALLDDYEEKMGLSRII